MSGKWTSRRVHPIIRQIIDRDCHVSLSGREVVRHVISKLSDGYATFRTLSSADRRTFIEQCLAHHRANFELYAHVMRGAATRMSADGRAKTQLRQISGPGIVRLMRQHEVTISGLAFRLGMTEKRVRQVRRQGLAHVAARREWLEAITGGEIGPLPDRYRIHRPTEEAVCGFCGCPLDVGDDVYAYLGEVFCSTFCCRKRRRWS